jgi:TIR domain
MADIFISHSGRDNEVAAAIGERIRRERPTWSLFYDKDNIRAGQHWQERLREELTSCRVVLALLSRSRSRGGRSGLKKRAVPYNKTAPVQLC